MTLIVTQFSQHGIVLAADSNISADGELKGIRRKLFKVPSISAGVAYAGCFTVGGVFLDDWMHQFIADEDSDFRTLRGFCDRLVDRLNCERTDAEKRIRVIAHIAGYVSSVPTMWHVSNVELLLDEGGKYSEPVPVIAVKGPDFDRPQWDALQTMPVERMPLTFFVNGPVQGRIAYNTHERQVSDWLRRLWQSELPFQAPTSIEEQEDVTRTSMEIMRLLFRMSPMSATIGGAVQSLAISPAGLGEVSFVTETVPDALVSGPAQASVDADDDL